MHEIFEIVQNLNRREKVSFLLAEQNAVMALKFAEFGYILENGCVVIEGTSAQLAQNEDVRDVKHYRRRKRWLA